MMIAVASLTTLGLSLGLLLGLAARYLKVEADPLVDEIKEILPGSQCGQCGYAGCAQAAAALASGEAAVTLCPPGGRALAETLVEKLGVTVDLSGIGDAQPMLARIRKQLCIGCTRCLKVCPTDAIIGGPKQLHVVILEACTGCGNCVEVCPTECLQNSAIEVTLGNWHWPKPELAA